MGCRAGGPALESERRFAKKTEATMARVFVKQGGGGDGRCDAEEPTGRYAAYSERTITVETGLAIALGDGAAYRRLRRRIGRVEPGQARRLSYAASL